MGILSDVIRWKQGEQQREQQTVQMFKEFGSMLMKQDGLIKSQAKEKQIFQTQMIANGTMLDDSGKVVVNPGSDVTQQKKAKTILDQEKANKAQREGARLTAPGVQEGLLQQEQDKSILSTLDVEDKQREGLLESSSEFQQAGVSKRAGETADADAKVRKNEIGAKIKEGGIKSLTPEEVESGVGDGQIKKSEITQKDILNIATKSAEALIEGNFDLQDKMFEDPSIRTKVVNDEIKRVSDLYGVKLPKGLAIKQVNNDRKDQTLPDGVTEEDISTTMKKHKMTRDEVISKLGSK